MNQPSRERPSEIAPAFDQLAATKRLPVDDPSSQLVRVLDQYLEDLQAGRSVNRERLLAEHPDLASQLEPCLAGMEFIQRAAVPATGVPTKLGDFRILREIGRGGMGVVYEAEQVTLKRRVALKVLRYGAASDSEAMQRFQREAETVATLHHTNIVPIFAIGCENGVNYYAMQFIEGQSLACSDRIHAVNGPDESGHYELANWGLQAAEALAHAHHRGVIHRDIKPSNLILDPDGRIWLTDFGLAKRIDDVSLSMAGAILGTPRYMSPEQAAASKNPVDHRTDIYSLGATLYELATGRPLFEADSPHAVITQILTAAPPAPRLVRPDVPRDFETIILKCLAKEPGQRYATAQALADDLRAFVEGRAIKARRATLAEQAARWFKQQKRSVGIAATAVAATITIVVGSLIAWQMHGQSQLGYLTLNTPREGEQRAEVAEVLSLNDQPVGSPFTLPTKEPLALPEGAYRLRLTAPSKVSQTYLFDIAAGASVTHEVGLVNETIGHAIPLRSPVGVEVVADAASVRADAGSVGHVEPRLFIGPQDSSKPTLRCYSVASLPQERTVQEGSSINVVRSTEPQPLWEANWSLESPDIISFLKLPADREAWKVLPAQWEVQSWQQVLAWFDPWWFRNGSPPKVLQPARDLNGDDVEDVIWSAPQISNPATGAIGPGPLTPKAAMLVAASGKDGKPLWWFRPQDVNGNASRPLGEPIWCGAAIVAVMRSAVTEELWIEAVSPQTGESLWRRGGMTAFAPGTTIMLRTSQGSEQRSPTTLLVQATFEGQPVVIAVIGNQLLVLDATTGEPRRPAQVLPSYAYSARFADLDADGFPEALLTFMAESGSPRFAAFSVDRGEPLWETKVGVDSLQFQRTMTSLPWPFVEDLDGDGRPEVVLPSDGDNGDQVSSGRVQAWTGCRALEGATGKTRWERRFPIRSRYGPHLHRAADQYAVGPDLNGDGQRELFTVSVRRESRMQVVNQRMGYQREQYSLYVDCFSGRDGQSVWWQRIPIGLSELSTWTGTPDAPLLWGSHARQSVGGAIADSPRSGERGYEAKLVLPVRRHADQGGDGIGNAGARLLFVLSAETGRVEHSAEHLAFPQLVDWNNDGLDDLAVFVPDDPQQFAAGNNFPERPTGKFVVLRGSPPEAFRRLDRWVEEQDFDGDGFAELSQRYHGHGDYAIQIASGRDGHIMSKWKTEWPETPRSFTVGNVQSFAPPLGDFDGDGLADLLVSREGYNWDFERVRLVETGKAPLLMQAISSKTGKRIWGGVPLPLPDWLRPKDADENSDEWKQLRNGRLNPISTQAVDLDGDGRPEVLQSLQMVGYRRSEQDRTLYNEHQQPFVALIDGGAGTLRWCEPLFDAVRGSNHPGQDHIRIDASTDLNGDGTRDLVLTAPQQDPQGSWSQSLQVHSGRDGKVLWGPKPLEGASYNNNDFAPPIVSDLDGDGRPEIVLMPTKQPHVTVLRGDTGEPLWTWQGSQPQYFQSPGIAVVAQSSRHAPRDVSRTATDADRANDAQSTKNADSALGSPHAEREGYVGLRCIAVAFNETGSQWNLVLLDHTGQELEKIPCQSSQLWSHDLDGDGGEELLWSGNKIQATRGLHDVLWSWSPPPQSYGGVSHIERTADGRVIVVMGSSDSVTLLDGKTGKPLGRTWKSCNTSINENGRMLDLNRPKLNSAGESPRLLTRVGDSQGMFPHVVSRAMLPADDDGRYQRSRHAPRDEPFGARDRTLQRAIGSQPQKAHHAERDGYVDDPRLVRQLPWAPSASEQSLSSFWTLMLVQSARAIMLSLVIVLIPFGLIRAGVRRRELGWWRGVLIVAGMAVIALSIAAMKSFASSPGMRGLPWGAQLAMAFGALPILAWLTAFLRNVFLGEWRRLRWLLSGSALAALVLGAVILAMELPKKPPEQHYSWHGWWFILFFGAFAVGVFLLAWRGFGPYVCWLWNCVRRKLARHG